MFLRWWKQRDTSGLAGLDISPDFVKLLKIDSSNKPLKVDNFAISPLPAGVIIKDEIKDPAAVSTVIKNMYAESGLQTKNIALSVPRSSAIIKNILVDKRLSTQEIESRVWFEASHHFPDLVGDIYLDFSVLGTAAQDDSQLELMLVACRKDRIKPYIDLLKQAGLHPRVIDVNSYVLERAMLEVIKTLPNVDVVALLNLDYHLSTLIVMQKNKLIFSHDHSYDGKLLLEKVNAYLKNKDNIKIDDQYIGSMQEEDEYMGILQEKLSAHLRHIMHFFYSSRPNIAIQQLILSGECANIFNLATFVQRETGIETILADPFIRMVLAPTIPKDILEKHASMLMLSCGLSLSQLPE